MPDIFNETPTQQPTQQTVQQDINTVAPVVKDIEQKAIGLFTTFCRNPRGISFAEQDDDETIILFLRRDFITNVPWLISTIALAYIPFLVRFIFVSTNFSLFTLPDMFSIPLVTFYYLIVLGFAFANLVSWFYNIGLVTDKRGVDLDFNDLSTINVATASLPDIKDVEYTQAGFFQSLFDYGDIRVRLVATGEVFTFSKVPRPTEVSGIISRLIGKQVQ
ncbi:MAG TPA: hypothetical protein VLF93_01305 [Candidatus Saccharimonadales bacterium]|nr:hypothetical protein [Candidatus Saccharimonadales bacterium]